MPEPASYRILVVDDDQVLLDLTQVFLPLSGHEVTVATSGAGALALLQGGSAFDVVLTDLHMPGLDGAALASALRSAMGNSALLIGMSSKEPSAATAAHFDAFFPKPFDPQELGGMLRSAVRDHEARADGNPAAAEMAPDQPEPPVLNETILNSLARTIPPPQLRKLYEMGIGDAETRYARMQDFLLAGDLPSVKREAHAIKGSAGMVGATELQTLAAAVEDSADLDASSLARIPQACHRLRRMLDAKLLTV